jgi:hypothetical protein
VTDSQRKRASVSLVRVPWWILEIARFAVMIAGAILVQQLIRRHGKVYAAEVFHEAPRAGTAFVALADIAYYLIVLAYALFTLDVDRNGDVTARQVQNLAYTIGGLALIIGLLHGFNIVVLPAMGRTVARRGGGQKHPSRPRER